MVNVINPISIHHLNPKPEPHPVAPGQAIQASHHGQPHLFPVSRRQPHLSPGTASEAVACGENPLEIWWKMMEISVWPFLRLVVYQDPEAAMLIYFVNESRYVWKGNKWFGTFPHGNMLENDRNMLVRWWFLFIFWIPKTSMFFEWSLPPQKGITWLYMATEMVTIKSTSDHQSPVETIWLLHFHPSHRHHIASVEGFRPPAELPMEKFIFYVLWFLWKINGFIFGENLQKSHQFYPQIADAVRKNVSQKPTNSGIQNWHRSPWVGGNPAKKCSPHLQVHGWYKSIIPEWAALPYSVHHSKPLGLLPPVLILSHSHPLKKSPTFRASILTSLPLKCGLQNQKKKQSLDVSWNFPRPSVLT